MSKSVSKANNDILTLLNAKSVNTKETKKRKISAVQKSSIVAESPVSKEKVSDKKSKSVKAKPKALKTETKVRKGKKSTKEKEKEEFTAETTHEMIIMHLPIAPENIDLIEQQFSENKLLEYNPNLNDPKPYSNVYETVYGSSTGMIIDTPPENESKDMSTPLDFTDSQNNDDKSHIDIENVMQKREEDTIIFDNPLKDSVSKGNKQSKLVKRLKLDDSQSEDDMESKPKVYFQVLPNIYSLDGKSEWPSKTNQWCWWCCHSFDSVPIPCPKTYNRLHKKFMVYGCFCSFNCVLSYNDSIHMPSRNSYLLIKGLQTAMTSNNSDISPAPPRQTLKVFGGTLTIQEFRKSFNNGIVYSFMQYPFMPYTQYIETAFKTRTGDHTQSSGYCGREDNISKDSPLLTSPVNTREEKKIRLKRNKPLPQANNTLDALLKLRS